MEKLTDNSIMTFGKHKGKPLCNVPAFYLIYIFEQGYDIAPELKAYIIDNMDALKKEAGQKK